MYDAGDVVAKNYGVLEPGEDHGRSLSLEDVVDRIDCKGLVADDDLVSARSGEGGFFDLERDSFR